MRFTCSRPAILFSVLACVAGASPSAPWAQAGKISKDMEAYCVNDYKNSAASTGCKLRRSIFA